MIAAKFLLFVLQKKRNPGLHSYRRRRDADLKSTKGKKNQKTPQRFAVV